MENKEKSLKKRSSLAFWRRWRLTPLVRPKFFFEVGETHICYQVLTKDHFDPAFQFVAPLEPEKNESSVYVSKRGEKLHI